MIIHHSSILFIYILSAMLLSCVLSRVVYANNVPPHVPRGTQSRTQSNACARARMALAQGKLNFSCAVIGLRWLTIFLWKLAQMFETAILYIINDCFFNAWHYFFEFCEENVKILKSVSLFMVLALSNHRSNEILL